MPPLASPKIRLCLLAYHATFQYPNAKGANTKLKLQVFERKVLRRIYGPTKENDGTWRIKSNEELNRLIGNKKS